ncbi:hypothetical protein PPYR_15400 [Photinus pyralis]|uniref:DDE-1 domain-containing protein n=1 Tax=Photinus pyralis TaxID=7054 RepID=A0A5N3ZYW9_PHOPY|nr:hypothetical protein PPYR_15400 [Photinus pyralis]
MDSSKAATSVTFACSASGEMLPPYIVYKSENLWYTWREGGPDSAVYNRTHSGWFDASLFEDWFNKIMLPYFKKIGPGPKVLLGDNLASHISYNVVKVCQDNNIRFVLLPPNSTHLTQPLDVTCFRPIKNSWRKILQKWKKNHKGVIRKDHFPRLLRQALNEIKDNGRNNIIFGFAATGLHPLQRLKVLNRLPNEDEVDNPEVDATMTRSLTRDLWRKGSSGINYFNNKDIS